MGITVPISADETDSLQLGHRGTRSQTQTSELQIPPYTTGTQLTNGPVWATARADRAGL